MEKQIQILKKIKALADKGIGGEAVNAQKLFDKLLKKHGLSKSDIESEETKDYFFKVKSWDERLLSQIAKCVNCDIKVYDVTFEVKKHRLAGNILITCTAAEYIEIDQMFDVYSKLLKSEMELFYKAFLKANNLLVTPPKEKLRTINDLTAEEFEEWLRTTQIASTIKREVVRKQLPAAKS